jgi:Predicted membrane protein
VAVELVADFLLKRGDRWRVRIFHQLVHAGRVRYSRMGLHGAMAFDWRAYIRQIHVLLGHPRLGLGQVDSAAIVAIDPAYSVEDSLFVDAGLFHTHFRRWRDDADGAWRLVFPHGWGCAEFARFAVLRHVFQWRFHGPPIPDHEDRPVHCRSYV